MAPGTDPAVHEISVDEFDEFIENHEALVILDVREPGEHAAAHIPRSINIPLATLVETARAGTSGLDGRLSGAHEKTIVVYCADGELSRRAVPLLQAQGLERVYCLAGGLASWRAAGQAVIGEVSTREA